MSVRLRELIRSVRLCKTAAEERKVISRESALIRSAMKDEDSPFRARNIAKLLFIQVLGYPTNFCQMECLKMTASGRFAEKRIGYLGLLLLLSESDEVVMLITNSLKSDLNSHNQFVVGFALTALGSLSTPDMARDLASEVERLLGNSNPYVRKKAAVCALRLFRLVPEVVENIVPRIRSLLNDKNHGVLVASCGTIVEMCEKDPEKVMHFKRLLPGVLRILKSLLTSGYAPEHEVGGVADPFLQVRLLRLCRVLGRGDPEASEVMNDILAQVATNTDSSRSAANAVLYECVQTISALESEGALRALAINILGRFLSAKDNNIRYVALSTLPGFVETDGSSVQRLRHIVTDCLRDGDVSIRRRALALAYRLVDDDNVIAMVEELMKSLDMEEREFRRSLASRIYTTIERFSPNDRWTFDTTVDLIKRAGNYVPDSVLVGLVGIVAKTESIRHYAALQLLSALDPKMMLKVRQDTGKFEAQEFDDEDDYAPESTSLAAAAAAAVSSPISDALAAVSLWILGEYGDLLVAPPLDNALYVDPDHTPIVPESCIIDAIESVLDLHAYLNTEAEGVHTVHAKKLMDGGIMQLATPPVSHYAVTSLAKIGSRLNDVSERVEELLGRMRSHVDVELQQRSVEFSHILNTSGMSESLLANVPPPPEQDDDEELKFISLYSGDANRSSAPTQISSTKRETSTISVNASSSSSSSSSSNIGGGGLLDLGAPSSTAPMPADQSSATALLLDIFAPAPTNTTMTAAAPVPSPVVTTAPIAMSSGPSSPIMPIMAPSSPVSTTTTNTATAAPTPVSITAFNGSGLTVTFSVISEAHLGRPHVTKVDIVHSSSGPNIANYVFQAAVPKYLKLQMNPPSSDRISPSVPATQTIRIANASAQPGSGGPRRPVLMKLRIEGILDGSPVQLNGETSFPVGL